MSFPSPPVLLKQAKSDKTGVLVNWIAPANCRIETYTVSYKAESWWQAATATVPHELSEFLISEIPANEKITVWVYSTNEFGSSPWSDPAEFISSRDCGLASSTPDITKEVAISRKQLFDVLYTPEFDKFAVDAGLVSNIDILSIETKGNKVHKLTRVTPPIPESIRSMIQNYMGEQIMTYDDESVKHLETFEIEFKIKNVPLVDKYVETAQGRMTLIEVDDTHCRLEGHFDLRINYPVIGYYVAQVIRSQVVHDLTNWPDVALRFLRERQGLHI
jgi:hypothetical protein